MRWYWWYIYGKFPPDEETDEFPDPRAVIAYFQETQEISWQKLAEILGTKEGAARYVVRDGIKLNRISCRRILAQELSIPPRLLGLDDENRSPFWWRQLGYPFDIGTDGYPKVEQVVRYFRERTIKQLPNGTKTHWSQQDLAEAFECMVTRKTIIAMETTGKGTDFISRRRALAQLINIMPISLLGLAEICSSNSYISSSHLNSQQTINKSQIIRLSTECAVEAKHFYDEYYQHHGQDFLFQAMDRVKMLQVLEKSSTKEISQELRSHIAHYHKFVILVTREQQNYPLLFSCADESVAYAKEQGFSDDIALSLLLRAEARREQGKLGQAIRDIQEARTYAKQGSSFIQCRTLIEASVIHAEAAQDQADRNYALKLLDAATQFDGWLEIGERDFTKFDHGFYHLRRIMVFAACKDTRNATDELYIARKRIYTARRLVTLSIYEAQQYLRAGEFDLATSLLFEVARESKMLRSKLNRTRIAMHHQTLLSSSYGRNPDVARLGLLLQNWQ